MDLKTYMARQIQEALKHKWCKGIEIKGDPGEAAVSEWIMKYAAEYRREYEDSFLTIVRKVRKHLREKGLISNACKSCPGLEEMLDDMTLVIIKEFTDQWTEEMAKPDHDSHLAEI
jgi:hypothetical protein